MKRDTPATPFQKGCSARYAGTSLAECPYSFNTPEARNWRDGWKRVDDTLAKQPKQPKQPAKEGA